MKIEKFFSSLILVISFIGFAVIIFLSYSSIFHMYNDTTIAEPLMAGDSIIMDYDYQEYRILTDNDFLRDFDNCCSMNYDDYVLFCENYNLEQCYTDSDIFYVVYSEHFNGISSFTIESIYFSDSCLIINTSEQNWGAVADTTLRVIVIPVEEAISPDNIFFNNDFTSDDDN